MTCFHAIFRDDLWNFNKTLSWVEKVCVYRAYFVLNAKKSVVAIAHVYL